MQLKLLYMCYLWSTWCYTYAFTTHVVLKTSRRRWECAVNHAHPEHVVPQDWELGVYGFFFLSFSLFWINLGLFLQAFKLFFFCHPTLWVSQVLLGILSRVKPGHRVEVIIIIYNYKSSNQHSLLLLTFVID